MKIDIWSDFVCPFCYMGDAHLTQALEKAGVDAEIEYHSFQLDPELDYQEGMTYESYMVETKGMSRNQNQQLSQQVTQMGAAAGLDYRFDKMVPANTMKAHRLFQYAKEVGLGKDFFNRLYRAHFTEGENLNQDETLRRLAVEVGLETGRVDQILADSQEMAEPVHQDLSLAQSIGIQGVPFFIFDGKYAVSGAQPVESFVQAIQQIKAGEVEG